jgi:hypothetical protein
VCRSLQRTGADYEVELAVTVTPLGAISRLEHGLDGFEEEQRRYRQRLEDGERRLTSYRSRYGGAFTFADGLSANRRELRDIEILLAADVDGEGEAAAA